MHLYLLRHGIPVPNDDTENMPDSNRPLTSEGIERMRKAAKGLRRLKLMTCPDKARILHWLVTSRQLRLPYRQRRLWSLTP